MRVYMYVSYIYNTYIIYNVERYTLLILLDRKCLGRIVSADIGEGVPIEYKGVVRNSRDSNER